MKDWGIYAFTIGSIDKIVLLHLLEQSSMSISGLSFANSCRIVSSWSSTMFSHWNSRLKSRPAHHPDEIHKFKHLLWNFHLVCHLHKTSIWCSDHRRAQCRPHSSLDSCSPRWSSAWWETVNSQKWKNAEPDDGRLPTGLSSCLRVVLKVLAHGVHHFRQVLIGSCIWDLERSWEINLENLETDTYQFPPFLGSIPTYSEGANLHFLFRINLRRIR